VGIRTKKEVDKRYIGLVVKRKEEVKAGDNQ
jgi:hypothetical protein